MFEVIKKLVTKPSQAIAETRKKLNSNLVVSLMVIEWILVALGATILVQKASLSIFIGTLIAGIFGTLFTGLLMKIIYTTLDGKGGYIEGLASVTYSVFPFSFGFIVSSILLLGSYPGLILAALVFAVYAVMSLATLYKAGKEFFKVDMVTSLVGVSVLIGGVVLSIYAVVAFELVGTSLIKGSSPALSKLFAMRLQ